MIAILKRVFLIALVVIVFGLVLVLSAHQYYVTFEPSRALYPIIGIDVSHHQGKINWEAVATDKVDFVYMKATEGGDWKDRRFKENWVSARRSGIQYGAYHFFTFCRSGEEQALNFIDSVPNDSASLPPAIDLEFGGNCKNAFPKNRLIKEIEAYSTIVHAHYGKEPVLYVTREFYNAYANERFMKNHRIWARSIVFEPNYLHRDWTVWQFHNRGTRKGIKGPVDLNAMRKPFQ